MKKPTILSSWDFSDTECVPDGYDMTDIPKATTRNFNKLLGEYNNLVEVVDMLIEKHGITFEE